eukprot:4821855-Alexandrium_andersonii.AAC.1
MSASLVGSEMCIRDRPETARSCFGGFWARSGSFGRSPELPESARRSSEAPEGAQKVPRAVSGSMQAA